MLNHFLSRIRKILPAALIAASVPIMLSGSEVAGTIIKVQELLKQKDYQTAKTLIAKSLKSNQDSWQLWMSLGYVFEASQEYDKALAAFMQASELKTGIDGLEAKITRLQELAKNQAPKQPEPETPVQQAASMMAQAHKLFEQGRTLEAGRLFVEAVEIDRSLLARDIDLIEKCLVSFKKNTAEPENQFYLGAFFFYAGQYTSSEAVLKEFVEKYHTSDKLVIAQRLLKESREIIAQAVAANLAATRAEAEAKAARDNAVKASATASLETKTAKKPRKDKQPEVIPDFSQEQSQQNLEQNLNGEHPALVYARKKALALLEEYEHETDEEKKAGLIWNIGLLRLPIPEVMNSFNGFLASDNVDTIFATLEALEKIDQPGATMCLQQLYKLLGNDDFRVVYRAIKAFGRLPMSADRVVPRIFKIYAEEKMPARRMLIENTVKAYGTDAVTVLDAMLKEAHRADKRPIAELLSAITGEEIESLINKS